MNLGAVFFCWQFDMQFSYATHLAHPVLCRPTHLNISGYASAPSLLVSVLNRSVCLSKLLNDSLLKMFSLVATYWINNVNCRKAC